MSVVESGLELGRRAIDLVPKKARLPLFGLGLGTTVLAGSIMSPVCTPVDSAVSIQVSKAEENEDWRVAASIAEGFLKNNDKLCGAAILEMGAISYRNGVKSLIARSASDNLVTQTRIVREYLQLRKTAFEDRHISLTKIPTEWEVAIEANKTRKYLLAAVAMGIAVNNKEERSNPRIFHRQMIYDTLFRLGVTMAADKDPLTYDMGIELLGIADKFYRMVTLPPSIKNIARARLVVLLGPNEDEWQLSSGSLFLNKDNYDEYSLRPALEDSF